MTEITYKQIGREHHIYVPWEKDEFFEEDLFFRCKPLNQEIKKWLKENIRTLYRHSMSDHMDFEFVWVKDAMAFKLAWC